MCKYCNLITSMDGMIYCGKDLFEDEDNGCLYIFQDEESNFGLRYKDYEDDEHDLPIWYCPICGKKLNA